MAATANGKPKEKNLCIIKTFQADTINGTFLLGGVHGWKRQQRCQFRQQLNSRFVRIVKGATLQEI